MSLHEKQRKAVEKIHGEPIGSIEVILYADGHASLWQNVNHSTSFAQVESALQKGLDHIAGLLKYKSLCPFNPDFNKEK